MSKKYRLLKDLPDIPAGTNFTWTGKEYLSETYNDGTMSWRYPKETVENNTSWFEEIVEPESNKETPFVWDGSGEGFLNYLIKQKEDAVKRHDFTTAYEWRMVERLYRSHLLICNTKTYKGEITSVDKIVEEYLKKEQSKNQTKPKTERIEVSINADNLSSGEKRYWIDFSKTPPENEFWKIKSAIETALNNDKNWFKEAYEEYTGVNPRRFTQQEMDKAREEAFSSARNGIRGFDMLKPFYSSFTEYQSHLNKAITKTE